MDGQAAWPGCMAGMHGEAAWPGCMARMHVQAAWPSCMAGRTYRAPGCPETCLVLPPIHPPAPCYGFALSHSLSLVSCCEQTLAARGHIKAAWICLLADPRMSLRSDGRPKTAPASEQTLRRQRRAAASMPRPHLSAHHTRKMF
eukprot:141955-Chlamydomonas_euryale.AAC.2